MKWDLVRVSAYSAGAGLGTIYLVFLLRAIALSRWSGSSGIELVIFFTLILRLTVVVALAKYVSRQPVIAYILLSLEVFLIPVLAMLQLWTGDAAYTALMSVILTSWIGASAIIVSPYAIYEFARGMTRTRSLLGVFAIGTFEVAGMLFLVSVVQEARSVIVGPAGLGQDIIQVTSYSLGSIDSISATSIALSAALVVFFVSTVVYISLGRVSTLLSVGLSRSFLIPLCGIVAAAVWVLASLTARDVLLVFTLPTLIGVAGIWVVTRDK